MPSGAYVARCTLARKAKCYVCMRRGCCVEWTCAIATTYYAFRWEPLLISQRSHISHGRCCVHILFVHHAAHQKRLSLCGIALHCKNKALVRTQLLSELSSTFVVNDARTAKIKICDAWIILLDVNANMGDREPASLFQRKPVALETASFGFIRIAMRSVANYSGRK